MKNNNGDNNSTAHRVDVLLKIITHTQQKKRILNKGIYFPTTLTFKNFVSSSSRLPSIFSFLFRKKIFFHFFPLICLIFKLLLFFLSCQSCPKRMFFVNQWFSWTFTHWIFAATWWWIVCKFKNSREFGLLIFKKKWQVRRTKRKNVRKKKERKKNQFCFTVCLSLSFESRRQLSCIWNLRLVDQQQQMIT